MNMPLNASIVRILGSDGAIKGAGFLVSFGKVVTCAHVVARAMGVADDQLEPPQGPIQLDFPFLDSREATAVVESWGPIQPNDGGDVAMLSLEGGPPTGARPARLRVPRSETGHAVLVYGFPEFQDQGVWFRGRLMGRRANGLVQLEREGQGYAIQEGFSGAPVWDPDLGAVIGMVVTADTSGGNTVASLLPADEMRRFCHSLPAANGTGSVQSLTAGLPAGHGVDLFLQQHVGTEGALTPFGGRGAELKALDCWLNDDAQPYALLVAEPGRGKSSLLAQWASRVAASERADVALVPVGIPYRSADKDSVLSCLGMRLWHLLRVSGPMPSGQEGWQTEIRTRWCEERAPWDRKLLVVIDGADEAVGWDLAAAMGFPLRPGRGWKVVISTRRRGDDPEATKLRLALGWTGVQPLPLPELGPEGVREVLTSPGAGLAHLAREPKFVDRLLDLTVRGDPLLVRLYVDAIRGGKVAADALDGVPPDLQGYMEVWWNSLKANNPKELASRSVGDTVLNLIACARGPLLLSEISAMVGSSAINWIQMEEVREALGRITMGDGLERGFVFSHPRLAWYFSSRMERSERQRWEALFLGFGKQVLDHLCQGDLAPSEAPEYAVRYYGRHLEEERAPAADLYALVSPAWRDAWHALDGSYVGFLQDVERARAVAARTGNLTVQITCALCRSSVASVGANVPESLMLRALECKVITPGEAMAWVRQKAGNSSHSHASAVVFPFLDRPMQERLLEEVETLPDLPDRAALLAEMAPHQRGESDSTWRAVLEAVRLTNEEEYFFRHASLTRALTALAAYGSQKLVEEGLAFLMERASFFSRPVILAAMLSRLPEGRRTEVLQAVLAWPEMQQVWSAAPLFPYVPKAVQTPLLAQLLAQVDSLIETPHSAAKLAGLLPHLVEANRRHVLSRVLQGFREGSPAGGGRRPLTALVPHLPEDLLEPALAIAMEPFPDVPLLTALAPRLPQPLLLGVAERLLAQGEDQTVALGAIAPFLPEPERSRRLHQALKRARSDPERHTPFLVYLVPHLPEITRHAVIKELIRSKLAQPYRNLEDLLRSLSIHMPEPLREEVLVELCDHEESSVRFTAVYVLAPYLPDRLVREAMERTISIRDEKSRWSFLRALVPFLGESQRGQVTAKALPAARAETDPALRAAALIELLPAVGASERSEILRVVLASVQATPPVIRAGLLVRLAPQMIGEARNRCLRDAFAVIQRHWRAPGAAEVLWELLPHLDPTERFETELQLFDAAQDLFDHHERVRLMLGLLTHVEEPVLKAEICRKVSQLVTTSLQFIGDAGRLLEELAPHMPQELVDYIIREIRQEEPQVQVAVFSAMAERLGSEMLHSLLPLADELGELRERVRMRLALLYLAEEHERDRLTEEALALIQEMTGSKQEQVECLCALMPYLPEFLRRRALDMVFVGHLYWLLRSADGRNSLVTLTPFIPGSSPRPVEDQQDWQGLGILHLLSEQTRPEFMTSLRELLPLVIRLGGAGTASALAESVGAIGRWWS